MRKIFTLIFLITLSSNSFGQTLNEKEMYGKWNVEKIIKKPTNPQFAPLIEGFENSTFIFNQNGGFELKTTSKSELFGMITEMTNGTKWKVEKDKQFVKIGNEDDRYSIMGIAISEVNGKKIFYLDESGITLEMNKIE
ncbi:hypothetical protein [Formosa algae]|uniref:hypothetical protein n=1 Tax=Formosa algae TaxID=225843 RepID=UPI000CCDAA6A|nr:hypothetical protein [Formosa algae]PNW25110.1 hypothetical protein BKP44_19830 [Formosa algae]